MLSTALCLIRRRDRRARVQTVRVDRATDNERPGVTVHVGSMSAQTSLYTWRPCEFIATETGRCLRQSCVDGRLIFPFTGFADRTTSVPNIICWKCPVRCTAYVALSSTWSFAKLAPVDT